MRVSRTQAEENRQTVINVAGRLFREHGFDGIGLKELMKGAGLTQGAFYKQFASKQDLSAQAVEPSIGDRPQSMESRSRGQPEGPAGRGVAFYLSMEHRAEREDGCPVAALGSDAARQGAELKASFEAGIKEQLEDTRRLDWRHPTRRVQRQGNGDFLDDGRCGDPRASSQRHRSRSGLSRHGRRSGSRSRRRLKGGADVLIEDVGAPIR